MILALLLDLANIAGGLLLAAGLIRRLPRVGDELGRFADRAAPQGWIVGIVALALGAAYLLMHLLAGPRVFHFEVVGIGVGLALLWDRITGRRAPEPAPASDGPTGRALLLAVFGVVAVVVGLQGLFTPD
ncbi:hypothetical protein ACQP1P_34340 [Dactylosporangium sp. CA-052675]|uniref:hypothetical protein n=1 Tax=Dactylosporangium sp. CA-052675 TaxID=3239927 RepID=UPI003D924865